MTGLDVKAIVLGQILIHSLEHKVKLTTALLQAGVTTHRVKDLLTLPCLLGFEPVSDVLLQHRVLFKASILAAVIVLAQCSY